MQNITELLRAEHARHAHAMSTLVAAELAQHQRAVHDIFALAADGTESETSEDKQDAVAEAKPDSKPEPKPEPAAPKKPRRPRQAASFHPADLIGTTKVYDGVEYRVTGYISEAASHVKCALFEVENVATGAVTRLKSNLLL